MGPERGRDLSVCGAPPAPSALRQRVIAWPSVPLRHQAPAARPEGACFTTPRRAYGQAGRRSECLRALLLAERHAPEEIHARPAIHDLISGLLVSGRTSPELRGLALRCGLG
jgi:hypothetical protein